MQAEFDQFSGRLTFRDVEFPGLVIQAGVAWANYHLEGGRRQQVPLTGLGSSTGELPFTDPHGSGTQRVVHCPSNPHGIELTYRINTYPQQPFQLLQLSLQNKSRSPIYLDNLCLFQASPTNAGRVLIEAPDAGLRFFKVGWHGWDFTGSRGLQDRNRSSWLDHLTSLSYSNPATRKPVGKGEFSSEGWGVLAGADAAVVTGFVSTAHQFGQVYACIRPGDEALMLLSQLDGVRLDPDETCDSEWGYLQFVHLPNPEPAAHFVEAVARHMNARVPVVPPPPMWTHWYHFYHNISEQIFLQNLDALVERKAYVPYQVVELDDGYQSAWGDWTSTNAKFPHGLGWLSEQIVARGFTPGLWLAPFVVQSKSLVAWQHPDWLVKNDHGNPAMVGFQYNMFTQALDLTQPAVLEHLRSLADLLTHQLGYGMLKLDFINAAALPGRRSNPKITRAEALRLGLEAIRQGAGENTFLLASGSPFGPAIGVMDAMRISPDTAPSWEPHLTWLPWAGPLIRKEPSMPSLRNALRHTLNLSSLNKRWWWNDPDCLLVRDEDSHLNEAEVQSAITLVGLSGGMLVSSDDFRKLSLERLKLISLLVPNLGLRGLPLDWIEHEMPVTYRVVAPQGRWQSVALFNWSDHSATLKLEANELGYGHAADLHVFDFWGKQYHRVKGASLEFAAVPAHGCKLLRVCDVGDVPQVVGDTLHISQGAEIASMQLLGENLVVETVDMGRNVEGELWLWLPSVPIQATCNKEQVAMVDDGEGVYSFNLKFIRKAIFEISF